MNKALLFIKPRLYWIVPIVAFFLLYSLFCIILAKKGRREFDRKKERLFKSLKSEASKCSGSDRAFIESLVKTEIRNDRDIERLEAKYRAFVLHHGNMPMVEQEMKMYDSINDRNDYESSRHVVNFLHFLVPFVAVFCLIFFPLQKESGVWFLTAPVALIGGGFAALIGMIIGYSVNIARAGEYGLADDDPMVMDERRKRTAGIIATIVSGGSIFRHTKKTVKDIENVDGWKEMK